VSVKHKDYATKTQELATDKHGKVSLGPLENVETVTAESNPSSSS